MELHSRITSLRSQKSSAAIMQRLVFRVALHLTLLLVVSSKATIKEESLLVSPIINRELETSVIAHNWPSTPQNLYCEAYVYHCRLGSGVAFLDALAEHSIGSSGSDSKKDSYVSALSHILQVTPLTGTAHRLLQVTLAMRANSPWCELTRGLARETLIQQQRIGTTMLEDVFAVVAGKIILFSEFAETSWKEELARSPTARRDLLLPDELVLGPSVETSSSYRGNETAPFVILYANLDTASFGTSYGYLKDASVPFVVRYLGAVGFEDGTAPVATAVSGTVLQGYGVRLDIRNVEYKVFDDRSDGTGTSDGDQLLDLAKEQQESSLTTPNQFLAGVNLTALGLQDPDLVTKLWSIHDQQATQYSIIPPMWRRRKLPLQATAAILSSVDPLATLQEIAQDLPSLASTLVNVEVPEEIHQAAELLEDAPIGQPGLLYVNGRVMSLERPSFNFFELLNVLQEEQLALQHMQDRLGGILSPAALQQVQKAWTFGKKFLSNDQHARTTTTTKRRASNEKMVRIDVGRGWKKAVIYLNDVEKDVQYSRWSRSMRQMFMNMQMGMPPSVRRNLFTILAVIDPLEDMELAGIDLGLQLMQGGYPARMGFLPVDSNDLQECDNFLKTMRPEEDTPCPVKPLINESTKSNQLDQIKAGAQAVHALLSISATHLGDTPGGFSTYGEYLISLIREAKDTGSFQSLNDLLELNDQVYEGLHVSSSIREKVLEYLKTPHDDPLYGHSLRFAVERNLKPGMSFLNGRPIPLGTKDDAVSKIFSEEQNHVFGLIMNGEITDTSPKSVYASLLSGDRVYKKAHPLLTGEGGDKMTYMDLKTPFSEDSLLTPKDQPTSPEASFIVDGVFDVGTANGVSLALKFVSVMDSFPTVLDDTNVRIAYRILPSASTGSESPFCVLFAHAATVGIDALKDALSKWEPALSLDDLLKKINLSSEAEKGIKQTKSSSGFCNFGVRQGSVSESNVNFVLANGRNFVIEGADLVADDIELLLSIEMERSKIVSTFLDRLIPLDDRVAAAKVGLATSYLSLQADLSVKRSSIGEALSDLASGTAEDRSPLHLSFNKDADASLEIQLLATIDPVSVGAQRLSPFLRTIRDELHLPLDVLFVPPSVFQGDSSVPLTSYYRFVADPSGLALDKPVAYFSNLPMKHVLTLRTDVPESWDVQQTAAIQDTDNLRCDTKSGCGDVLASDIPVHDQVHLTSVEYGLNSLLVFGQCYEPRGTSPNGLQLTLVRATDLGLQQHESEVEINEDGTLLSKTASAALPRENLDYSDTLVMKNVGYWQLRANPGMWKLSVAKESKGATMFDMVDGEARDGRLILHKEMAPRNVTKTIYMKDFVNRGELLIVKRKPGIDEKTSLFYEKRQDNSTDDDTIHVFSLATGHLYERFLKIMMLSVTKRTTSKVKFWLFENFLSPTFKSSAKAMAERIGCDVAFVTYKWPEWLRGQSEKQRIIWGYKILFLDVLFPLSVKKIIYVDADQVVRGDLKELWDMDLEGAPYGYTPFCSSRQETLGYQFWREGFWKNHLQGRPYHISALYVVDLDMFRRKLVGDQLRSIYQQLSADPNSLANLDQDLPNYAQHTVPIFSLPQEWLWCESWCSDESKAAAKTIDLCNNPMHKEPKVSMAKRVISGPLFKESWVELDAEVERYDQEYRQQQEKVM